MLRTHPASRLCINCTGRSSLVPVSGGNECGPEERMRALTFRAAIAEYAQASVTHSVRCGAAFAEPAVVERPHPVACGLIVDRPQAHDDCVRSSNLKGAPESEDPFSGPERADAGITG